MLIRNTEEWTTYLSKLPTEKFRRHLDKRRRRFERKKNGDWSYSSRQRYGSFYQTELRHKPTAAEIAFGNILCELGFSFQFQKSVIKPRLFILDFFLPSHFVAFEIDGSSHIGKKSKDQERDAIVLCERGIKTYRFTNDEVYRDSTTVKE